MPAYILKIGDRAIIGITSLAEASAVYCKQRDKSHEGASTFPEGDIYQSKGKRRQLIARVSYNGRIQLAGENRT